MDPVFAFIIYVMQEQLKLVHLYNQQVTERNAKLVAENSEMRGNLDRLQKLTRCTCVCCDNNMDTD